MAAAIEAPLPPALDTLETLEEQLRQKREALNQINPEAKGAVYRSKINHCPFGCTDADLDEWGYCHHLVGFANPDGKTYEEQTPAVAYDKTGRPYLTGRLVIGRKKVPIEPGDQRKNPARVQKIPTGTGGVREEVALAWVNDRIYRNRPKPNKDLVRDMPVDEEMALKAELADLRERAERKRLLKEIEDLKAELGDREHAKGRK